MPADPNKPCIDQPCVRPRAPRSSRCHDHKARYDRAWREARGAKPRNRETPKSPLKLVVPDDVQQGGDASPLPTFEDVARHGWQMSRAEGATNTGAAFLRATTDALKAIHGLEADTVDESIPADEIEAAAREALAKEAG